MWKKDRAMTQSHQWRIQDVPRGADGGGGGRGGVGRSTSKDGAPVYNFAKYLPKTACK